MDLRLREITMKPDMPFGSVRVILVGGHAQLPPVYSYSLWDPKILSDADIKGKYLWFFFVSYFRLDYKYQFNCGYPDAYFFTVLCTGYVTGSINIAIGKWLNRRVVGTICLQSYDIIGVSKMRISLTFTLPINNFTQKMSMSWKHYISSSLWLKR